MHGSVHHFVFMFNLTGVTGNYTHRSDGILVASKSGNDSIL